MKFLYNAPAILYKKALIIGDTHFGMEQKLLSKGIHYQDFSDGLFLKIKSMLKQTKAEKLIILGDVKEQVATLDPKTAGILAKLNLLTELIIVRGNHDGGIEGCGARIVPSGGFVFGVSTCPTNRARDPRERCSLGLGLVHGHSWPSDECMNADYLICAHQHPTLSIVDKSGKRHSEPVWIIAEADEGMIAQHYKSFNKKIKLVLIPAFNPLVGAAFDPLDAHLGPILSNKLFKIDAAIIYRLEGTPLRDPKKS